MPPRSHPAVETAASKPEDDIPACQSCRKKKAKCNRAQPCSQCTRYDVLCVYDDKRVKPGLRAGAMDQLYRRIEAVENMFLGKEMLWQQMWQAVFPNASLPIPGVNNSSDLGQQREQLKASLLQLGQSAKQVSDRDAAGTESCRPAKRARLEDAHLQRLLEPPDSVASLPDEIMAELVDFYFVNIHPWIPILHVTGFRQRMQSPDERPRLNCILHAIISVCVRFSQHDLCRDPTVAKRIAEVSRQKVILESTESFSVENLQALVIVAFETFSRGRGPSSWSILGSMVGTVEQLQLGVEEDVLYRAKHMGETLIQRMVFLTPSNSWREAEERRRVFWTVFLMDRFCSVSTGWKISLTNADVKRRLPCEGALWEKEQEVETPYFGISDSKETASSSSVLTGNRSSEDEGAIGGFAYNIEATESLALVTNFFLHDALVVTDASRSRRWLMKFKELDLRLVQWKAYLPPQWQEASVLNADGVMDPNLTLAHITHNTAVILLHQGIAYPPAHWQNCPVKLHCASSAETCLEAAAEIATIGQQFLSFSPIFTNPQFSFCLFIAGRMLLAHAKYKKEPVTPALDTLIASLMEISQRWAGHESPESQQDSLPGSFARRLTEAQKDFENPSSPGLDIRLTAYSVESKQPQISLQTSTHEEVLNEPMPDSFTIDRSSLAFPPLPPAFEQDFPFLPVIHPQTEADLWRNPESSSPQQGFLNVFNASSPGSRISRYGSLQEAEEPSA